MILWQFTMRIRRDRKYFNPKLSRVDVQHVMQSETGVLGLDKRDWGRYAITEDGLCAEDEDDEA
jgi:hypothetical protein